MLNLRHLEVLEMSKEGRKLNHRKKRLCTQNCRSGSWLLETAEDVRGRGEKRKGVLNQELEHTAEYQSQRVGRSTSREGQ